VDHLRLKDRAAAVETRRDVNLLVETMTAELMSLGAPQNRRETIGQAARQHVEAQLEAAGRTSLLSDGEKDVHSSGWSYLWRFWRLQAPIALRYYGATLVLWWTIKFAPRSAAARLRSPEMQMVLNHLRATRGEGRFALRLVRPNLLRANVAHLIVEKDGFTILEVNPFIGGRALIHEIRHEGKHESEHARVAEEGRHTALFRSLTKLSPAAGRIYLAIREESEVMRLANAEDAARAEDLAASPFAALRLAQTAGASLVHLADSMLYEHLTKPAERRAVTEGRLALLFNA
jgi:hypothetical protein